jgi:hypothetical protein
MNWFRTGEIRKKVYSESKASFCFVLIGSIRAVLSYCACFRLQRTGLEPPPPQKTLTDSWGGGCIYMVYIYTVAKTQEFFEMQQTKRYL